MVQGLRVRVFGFRARGPRSELLRLGLLLQKARHLLGSPAL